MFGYGCDAVLVSCVLPLSIHGLSLDEASSVSFIVVVVWLLTSWFSVVRHKALYQPSWLSFYVTDAPFYGVSLKKNETYRNHDRIEERAADHKAEIDHVNVISSQIT